MDKLVRRKVFKDGLSEYLNHGSEQDDCAIDQVAALKDVAITMVASCHVARV